MFVNPVRLALMEPQLPSLGRIVQAILLLPPGAGLVSVAVRLCPAAPANRLTVPVGARVTAIGFTVICAAAVLAGVRDRSCGGVNYTRGSQGGRGRCRKGNVGARKAVRWRN